MVVPFVKNETAPAALVTKASAEPAWNAIFPTSVPSFWFAQYPTAKLEGRTNGAVRGITNVPAQVPLVVFVIVSWISDVPCFWSVRIDDVMVPGVPAPQLTAGAVGVHGIDVKNEVIGVPVVSNMEKPG